MVPALPAEVICPLMSLRAWAAIGAATAAAVCMQSASVTARADLHNITYRARVDGVAPGSMATFVTGDKQTNMAALSAASGNAFEADTVLSDPRQAGMQVLVRWPYSANVHCEIDVDNNVSAQVDQFVRPVPGSSEPMNGVLACGAPLPNP